MKSINRKSNVLGIVVSLSLILIISNSFAYDHVVTGKGNPEYDVKAVKEAVDQGGKLLLKGSFAQAGLTTLKIVVTIKLTIK